MFGSHACNRCTTSTDKDQARDNLVDSTTSGVCPALFEGVAARRCCSAMTWGFDHRCEFYATRSKTRSLVDKLLDSEAVRVRSAFFRKGLVDSTERDHGFLSACRGGIGSFYC